MLDFNFVLEGADSYKDSHPSIYPKDTSDEYVYAEARDNAKWKMIEFFGLHWWLQEYFAGQVVTREKIDEAIPFNQSHYGSPDLFEAFRWEHILDKHGGYLPLEICAIPEGTIIPVRNVLYTVENTCEHDFWLPGFSDTLLTEVWSPIGTGTLDWHIKQVCLKYLDKTSDNPDAINFMLHDFGYRGSSGVEHARLSGAAHLVNFMGSDTKPAIRMLQKYYQAGVSGFSVPATEHTVTITHGREHEIDAFRNALLRFPTGILSIVIDSYDMINAVRNLLGGVLADLIRNRQGRLVVRPDSGKPEVSILICLEILGEIFGFTINSKGYKVLPPYVGVIQGDHIYDDTIDPILEAVTTAGWAADNVVFGCGGGLRRVERNDVDFAMKGSYAVVDGVARNISKNPSTDTTKRSKQGRFAVVAEGNSFKTIQIEDLGDQENLLRPVFRNGEILDFPNFADVRRRASVRLSDLLAAQAA